MLLGLYRIVEPLHGLGRNSLPHYALVATGRLRRGRLLGAIYAALSPADLVDFNKGGQK